jgi:hypothetical protein
LNESFQLPEIRFRSTISGKRSRRGLDGHAKLEDRRDLATLCPQKLSGLTRKKSPA